MYANQTSGHPRGAEPPDPIRSAFVMAVRVMEAGRASLLLRENADPVLTIAAAVGIAPREVPLIRVAFGSGIAGIVAQKGMTLLGIVRNKTFVSTPVVTRERVEGVLNLTERLGGRQYTGQDLGTSVAMAEHIAQLLEYRKLAFIDFVTELPNRRAFEQSLAREVARARRAEGERPAEFSVVFMDVDGLKAVNDRYGHAAGDELLRSVAGALLGVIRPYDIAARWGGDEFALLLSDTRDGEESVMGRISAIPKLAAGLPPGEYAVSIGIAHYPKDGLTGFELVSVAEERMYRDKRAHRHGRSAT